MPPTDTRHRDLRLIFTEGIAFSVMVGTGETSIAAFVLALGMGEVTSGLVATVPLLAGGILQLVSPIGIRRFGSRRRWSVTCAAIQAVSFVPLAAGAWLGRIPAAAVFAAATLYWAAGMAITPAWNVWVEQLVPGRARQRYFARRTSAAQFGLLAGLLLGGVVLDRAAAGGRALTGFGILFLLAIAGRAVSAALLSRQSEPAAVEPEEEALPALRLLRALPAGPGGSLVVYMLVLTAGVTVSSPYFSAYMLRQIDLTYWEYMSLLAVSLGAKVAVLPFVGGIARRFGLGVVLRGAWIGIAPLPALWLLSDSYAYLAALQIFSGIAWAAHEYATFLLLFQVIPARDRTVILTAHNLGNAVVTVLGSVAGALAFDAMGGGTAGFRTIFLSSSIARGVALVFLARVAGGVLPRFRPAFRVTAVRPGAGAFLRPIVATMRRRRGAAPDERDEELP